MHAGGATAGERGAVRELGPTHLHAPARGHEDPAARLRSAVHDAAASQPSAVAPQETRHG